MNIINELWEDVEGSDDFNNPVKSKIRKYLNKDKLQTVEIDEESKRYWLESSEEIPKYVDVYIKKYCKNKGYKYLYDL